MSLAVVVQELVPADAAGVLFTANPLTGARDEQVINAAWGLGEAVVGGVVTPDTHIVADGRVIRREIAEKTMMTVRTAEGTRVEPVPEDRRRAPVLDDAQAIELAALGTRIENLYGTPMDVEWALHNGRFSILQARPITTLRVEQEVWNDSLGGDYLWTCVNLGEAVPSVMTPATWSVVRILSSAKVGDCRITGNIGGRFYLNLSVSTAAASAVGLGEVARRASEQTVGRIPTASRSRRCRCPGSRCCALPCRSCARPSLTANGCRNSSPRHPTAARRCTGDPCRPAGRRAVRAVAVRPRYAAARNLPHPRRGRAWWWPQQDPGPTHQAHRPRRHDRSAHRSASGGELASLGPLLGLTQLRRGEIDRDTYTATWGHRGLDEFELSEPRPAEDPAWIDRLLDRVGDLRPPCSNVRPRPVTRPGSGSSSGTPGRPRRSVRPSTRPPTWPGRASGPARRWCARSGCSARSCCAPGS